MQKASPAFAKSAWIFAAVDGAVITQDRGVLGATIRSFKNIQPIQKLYKLEQKFWQKHKKKA